MYCGGRPSCKEVHLPEAAHQVLHHHVVGVGSLHLAVHILQNCPDELNHSNDEAAKRNGAQMVPAEWCHNPQTSEDLQDAWFTAQCMACDA